MAEGRQTGFLLLADISGYTSYVSATEIEHSNEILSDALEVITHGLTPPLTLAKLEGDAVFAYGPESDVPQPQMLLDSIDATYLAFRDRMEGMRRRTTCDCNACRAIPMLDLKFILHHGEYVIQRMVVGQELLGSDVNLIHRLLKNHVGEATGWNAYALCTEAAARTLSLPVDGLHEQVESYDHLGNVTTYSYDLRGRYNATVEARRIRVEPKEAATVYTLDIAAPPSTVWNWLNDPQRMVQWMGVDDMKPAERPDGRNGIGARNHCHHGKGVIVQTVLDWRPYDYFTLESKGPMTFLMMYRLTPTESGTRLQVLVKPESRLPGPVAKSACKMAMRAYKMQAKLEALGQMCAGECPSQFRESAIRLAVPS